MKRHFYLLAFGMFAVPACPLVAATPLGAWKLEPSDSRCVAVRTYGDAAKPMTLALKGSLSDGAIQLAVMRPGFRQFFIQTGAKIEIDGMPYPTSALSYPTAGNVKLVTHLINVDPAQAGRLRQAKVLSVDVYRGVKDSFPLEPSAKVWREMQDCIARVRKTWNVGSENASTIATSASGDLQGLFTPGDYPRPAVWKDQQGTTAFLLLIDEKGVPKDCTVIGSSGSAALDSRSCGVILVRGKFSPALGSDGKPVKSASEKRITWRME